MEQMTNVAERKERLVLSFSIKKGKGVELSKKLAEKFRDEKIRYKFNMTKNSYFYNFKNFYIKIYNDRYIDSEMEVVVYSQEKENKPIIDEALSIAQEYYLETEKNVLFLRSNVRYENVTNILKVDRRLKSEISFNKEGKIYDFTTKIVYTLTTDGETSNDNLYIKMIVTKNILLFLPIIFPKLFSEKERIRNGLKNNMEEII